MVKKDMRLPTEVKVGHGQSFTLCWAIRIAIKLAKSTATVIMRKKTWILASTSGQRGRGCWHLSPRCGTNELLRGDKRTFVDEWLCDTIVAQRVKIDFKR